MRYDTFDNLIAVLSTFFSGLWKLFTTPVFFGINPASFVFFSSLVYIIARLYIIPFLRGSTPDYSPPDKHVSDPHVVSYTSTTWR